jgi:hypothetical protein
MNGTFSFLAQVDRLGEQIAIAIQGSEMRIYAILALIVVAAFFAFPRKDDLDQI